MIAKAENVRKLTKPYILFDMCLNDVKAPKKLSKIMQDTKIILNDIDDFLKEPGEFVQKDYDEYQMMKTIYFTSDSRDFERSKPTFILFYSCLTDIAINKTKIGNFLKDLHRIVRDNYDPESFNSKTTINKEFANTCLKVLDNYNLKPYDKETGTGGEVINMKNVRIAGKKIDSLKEGLIKSVEVMTMNIESANDLEEKSQNLKADAYIFK